MTLHASLTAPLARRSFLGRALAAVGGSALAGLAPAVASAGAQWCCWDPELTVTTPKGAKVLIYVTLAGQGNVLSQLQATKFSTGVQAANGGTATLVTLKIATPPAPSPTGAFPEQVWVSSAPNATGTLYGTGTGTAAGAAKPFLFTFTLPVA